MKRAYIFIIMLLILSASLKLYAQNIYIATNTLDYLNFGTINAEFGLSPWTKCTFYIKGRYNPFTFNIGGEKQNRTASGAIGVKYWFWYTYSGWFVNTHFSYSKYNTGGIFNKFAYEGDAISITTGGGYALILNKKWNLDFAVGLQGGYTSFTKYSCPRCGRVIEEDKKLYLTPSNLMVQLTYIL